MPAEVTRRRRPSPPRSASSPDAFPSTTPHRPRAPPSSRRPTLSSDRGGADAVIVSGTATGLAADIATVRRPRRLVVGTPVLLGSGVTEDSLAGFLAAADGAIVGTAIKVDGITTNPVDPVLAKAMVAAAG